CPRREAHRHRPVTGRLRRQRHDRLPHGPLPPGHGDGWATQAVGRAETRRDHADHDGRPPLPRGLRRSARGAREFWRVAMRTITTASGTTIDLDGDVLAVLEAVSRDLMRRHALDYGFEEVAREFQHLIDQLSEEDLRTYLKESLFMSFN